MRALFKATLTLGAATAATILINMVRVKIVALLLGPEGVGLTSQVNTLVTSLTVLLYLGLGPGVAKFLAEANAQQDVERVRRVAVTSSVTVLVVSIVGMGGAILASAPLARLTLGDPALRPLVLLAVLAVPLAVIATQGRALLQGFKQVRALALAGVISTLISFIAVVPLVYYFKVAGAVANIGIAWAANAALFWWFYRRVPGRPRLRISAFDLKVLQELVGYGAATLTVSGALTLTALIIRSRIIAGLGAEQNGLYQAVYALSLQYMTLVTGAMGAYSLAHLAELGDRGLIVAEINNNLRLILLIMTPVLAAVLILRELGLVVLYSAQFLPAAPLFPLQVLGDFFQACAFAFGIALIPIGRARAYVGVNLAPTAFMLAASLVLLPLIGLQGVVLAYAIGMSIQVALGMRYLQRAIEFRTEQRNMALFARSLALLALLAGLALLPTTPGIFVARLASGLLLVGLWLRYALTADERRVLWQAVVGRIDRRGRTAGE